MYETLKRSDTSAAPRALSHTPVTLHGQPCSPHPPAFCFNIPQSEQHLGGVLCICLNILLAPPFFLVWQNCVRAEPNFARSVPSLLTQPHPTHCTEGQPWVWVLQSVLAPHLLWVGQSRVHGQHAPRALHFLWMGPSCSILPAPHSLGGAAGTVNVTLFENRIFADVITLLKILR